MVCFNYVHAKGSEGIGVWLVTFFSFYLPSPSTVSGHKKVPYSLIFLNFILLCDIFHKP
jgi:hypothetical protein